MQAGPQVSIAQRVPLVNRTSPTRSVRSPSLVCVLAIAGVLVSTTTAAEETRNWDLSLSVAGAYEPEYSGASARSPRLWVYADGSYRTEGFGSFVLDSGSLTIAPEARWDFVDSTSAGVGLLVGHRAGRDDRKPNLTSDRFGGTRLKGLPSVSDAIDAGVAGHVSILGVPLFAQVRAALNGSQGTLVNVGLYLPFEPAPDVELTILPTMTWADARQMRAFYGVIPAAAEASGFASYDPGAGWEKAAVEIGGDWRFSGRWHLVASVAYEHLLGHAARSPIVQTAAQPSLLAGITWHF